MSVSSVMGPSTSKNITNFLLTKNIIICAIKYTTLPVFWTGRYNQVVIETRVLVGVNEVFQKQRKHIGHFHARET